MPMKCNKLEQKNCRGFTIIELLAVLAVVGILATIGVVNASQGRQRARDNERKIALEQIRVALELYKDQHSGQYPCSGTCSSPSWYSSEPGDSTEYNSNWIPGLAPTYIGALPRDPLGGASSYSGNCSTRKRAYRYRSDGVEYVLLAHCSPERTILSSDPYYDTTRIAYAYKVCTPGGCDW